MELLDYYKVSEMMVPSMAPRPPRGTLGAAASNPVFKDPSGAVISSIECGQPYTFDVPGYTRVWLTMTRDGNQTFNGEFPVPMPSYVSSCATDVGTYNAIVYDLTSGIVLGQSQFVIHPAGSGGVTPPGGPGTGPLPPGTVSATISPLMIAAGLVGLYLFTRKSG